MTEIETPLRGQSSQGSELGKAQRPAGPAGQGLRGGSLVSGVRLPWRRAGPVPTAQLSPGHTCGLPEFDPCRHSAPRQASDHRRLSAAPSASSVLVTGWALLVIYRPVGDGPGAAPRQGLGGRRCPGSPGEPHLPLCVGYRSGSQEAGSEVAVCGDLDGRSGQRKRSSGHADPATAGPMAQGRPSELSRPRPPLTGHWAGVRP